jgi:hypothetical protein
MHMLIEHAQARHAYIMLIAGDRAADEEADGPRLRGNRPPLGDRYEQLYLSCIVRPVSLRGAPPCVFTAGAVLQDQVPRCDVMFDEVTLSLETIWGDWGVAVAVAVAARALRAACCTCARVQMRPVVTS